MDLPSDLCFPDRRISFYASLLDVGAIHSTRTATIGSTRVSHRPGIRHANIDPGRLLAPIAEVAADLLCYGNLAYLKKCEGADRVLHFYDTTKNHSLRWCSMAACGNLAKAATYYQRLKQETET